MWCYFHQLVQVGINIKHLKNVVRNLSRDSEHTCHLIKECECSWMKIIKQNDKVSRIEDFTTSKKDNNDKDDVSLLEEIKIFVIEKENVSVTELITMNIRMRKHKKMMFPIMILQRWKVLMKIKDSIRK